MRLLAGYRANRSFTPSNRWKRRRWRAFCVRACVYVCAEINAATQLVVLAVRQSFSNGFSPEATRPFPQICRTTTFRVRDGGKLWAMKIRGIFQPQMKILSSFNYPHVVPNFIFFLSSTKGDILNNVQAALFQAIAMNSNWTLQVSKRRQSIIKRS